MHVTERPPGIRQRHSLNCVSTDQCLCSWTWSHEGERDAAGRRQQAAQSGYPTADAAAEARQAYLLDFYGVPVDHPALSIFPVRTVAKIAVSAEGCWQWTGFLDAEGYAHGGGGLMHRTAYRLAFGAIQPGLELDHRCHTRALRRGLCHRGICHHRRCVNPDHLEAVTRAENNRRGRALKRSP